jgi:hypothetical protein
MAFGQSLGPPAPAQKVQELLTLLKQAGHADFRDARGPMGFTQRQAGGRFTRDEALAFIDQLQAAESESPDAVASVPRRSTDQAHSLGRVPAEELATELRRRGWIVVEPPIPQ